MCFSSDLEKLKVCTHSRPIYVASVYRKNKYSQVLTVAKVFLKIEVALS